MNIQVISALIGALIVGLFTVGTTLWLVKSNRKNLITGVMQGIHAELKTLWDIYENKFKGVHEKIEMGKEEFLKNGYIKEKYPLYLYDKYFIVYDSNCSRIGLIPDARIRREIVTGYLRARELIDAYLHNNELLTELEHLKMEKQKKPTQNAYDKDIKSLEDNLRNLAEYIYDIHVEVKKFYDEVGKFIEKKYPEQLAETGNPKRKVLQKELKN